MSETTPDPVATQEREPFLRELVHTEDGPFWQEWYCEVPPEMSCFHVLDEDWLAHDDDAWTPVRKIYRIGWGAPPGVT